MSKITNSELSANIITTMNNASSLLTNLNSHVANRAMHNYYGTASGANEKTISITGITTLIDGLTIAFKNSTLNTDRATLNVNSLGAKQILTPKGSAYQAGELVAGGIYTVRYSSDLDAFFMQGEAGLDMVEFIVRGYLATSGTMAIGTAVDLSRCFVVISSSTKYDASPVNRLSNFSVMPTLSDTTLKVNRGDGNTSSFITEANFEIIQLRAPMKVQTITGTLTAASTNFTISAVDMSKTFLINYPLVPTGSYSGQSVPIATLTSTTTVNMARTGTASLNFTCYVVTLT